MRGRDDPLRLWSGPVWEGKEEWLASLPDRASEELLKEYDAKLRKIYASCFDDGETLPVMQGGAVGEEMSIELKPGA